MINLYHSPQVVMAAPVLEEQEHSHTHEADTDSTSSEEASPSTGVNTLFEIDQQILELSKRQRKTRAKRQELDQRRERYQEEIKILNQDLKVDRISLMKLLTLRSRVKPARVIELLTSSDGPLEQKRREVYLKTLFKLGARRLKSLTQARQDLEARSQAIKTLSAQISQLEQALELQSEELSIARQKEWETISQRSPSHTGQHLLTEEAERRWHEAHRLPPARGKWLDEYRSFRGLSLAKLYGGGIWIMNARGAPVYSVEEGRVIFAGQVKGWDHVIIIQHHAAYLSIYGNVVSIRVSKGQRVAMQTQLGVMSDEAGRAALYFELRRGGEPIHPERWINLADGDPQ